MVFSRTRTLRLGRDSDNQATTQRKSSSDRFLGSTFHPRLLPYRRKPIQRIYSNQENHVRSTRTMGPTPLHALSHRYNIPVGTDQSGSRRGDAFRQLVRVSLTCGLQRFCPTLQSEDSN